VKGSKSAFRKEVGFKSLHPHQHERPGTSGKDITFGRTGLTYAMSPTDAVDAAASSTDWHLGMKPQINGKLFDFHRKG
jgi:hypothetical protein